MYRQTPITPREARLAQAVKDASAALAKARAARNTYIREQMAKGVNASDLARKFDMSRESLYKMLRKQGAPTPSPGTVDPTRLARLNQLERLKR
jgi:hypothetical protein